MEEYCCFLELLFFHGFFLTCQEVCDPMRNRGMVILVTYPEAFVYVCVCARVCVCV